MRTPALPILALGGAALLALGALGACRGSEPAAAAPPAPAAAAESPAAGPLKVERVTVELTEMPQFLPVTGNLVALEDSDVAAGAQGKVVAAPWERGQRVKKGDVLVQLDSRLSDAQAAEAKAQLQVAQANMDVQKLECERTEQLLKSGSVTTAAAERSRAACATAEAQVLAAQARARIAAANLGDTAVRAPFAGVIADRYVSPGEYVRPDSRVVTLLAIARLRVELTVPETAARSVKVGQSLEFTVAGEKSPRTSKITFVSPAVRRQSRDVLVEALVENEDGALVPGQFVSARLTLGDSKLPAVPAAAVQRDAGGTRVFVVRDNRIEERMVQLGVAAGDKVGVVSGLAAGEQVVAAARAGIVDGARVE